MRRNVPPRRSLSRALQRGYALILILVLVALGILYTVVSQVSVVGSRVARSQEANAAMLRAKEALIAYAATYGDTNPGAVFGYLPCPDTATKSGIQFPGDGNAAGTCSGADVTVAGLFPYKALGLEDLRDQSGTCLWYVVSGTFKNHIASSQPMNWDTQGQITVKDANDNILYAPGDANGGAAAVIIAAGPALATQSRSVSAYACGAMPAEIAAYIESGSVPNNAALVTLKQGSANNTVNNDQILVITPKEIFDRITVRADFKNSLSGTPAGIINVLTDNIRRVIETQMQSDLTSGTGAPSGIAIPGYINPSPPPPNLYNPVSLKLVGDPLSITVSNASWSALSSIATFTTATNHGLSAGQAIQISGIASSRYNGTYTVLGSGLTSTQFQVNIGSNPGAFTAGGVVTPLLFTPPYDAYFTHWRNQYRYAVCGDLSSCLSVANTSCRGALMFAGQSTTGPRGLLASSSATLGSFFEGAPSTPADPNGGLDILNTSAAVFSGHTAYSGSHSSTPRDPTSYSDPYTELNDRAFDVGTCIFAGDFVSFAQNINDFTAGANNSGSGANALSRTSGNTVQQGSSGGTAGSGCIWDINTLQLGKSLRLYFRVNFAAKGNGFTVALADGATNSAPNDGSRSSGQIIMCGAATSDSLGYAGIPPAGSSAGIKSPKLGVEFDTNFDSGRNDPHADHTALLFWGDAADNDPSGSGADDATHYAGVSPRNPRVATALRQFSIAGARYPGVAAGNQAVITTSSAHRIVSGDTVYIYGVADPLYNGPQTVSACASGTGGGTASLRFCYVPGNPPSAGPYSGGTAVQGTEISTINWSGGTATATSPNPLPFHSASSSLTASIFGVTPALYQQNNVLIATASPSFSYFVGGATNPGTFSTETPAGMFILRNSTSAPHSYLNYDSIPPATPIHVRLDIARSYDAINHRAVLNMKAYISDTASLTVDGCSLAAFQSMTDDLAILCPSRNVTLQQDAVSLNAIARISGLTPTLPVPPQTATLVTATTTQPHGLANVAKVTISGVTPAAYNGTYPVAVTGPNTFTYSLDSNPGTYSSGGDIQPLSTYYIGFTNARGSSSAAEDQSVTIDQLVLRSQ